MLEILYLNTGWLNLLYFYILQCSMTECNKSYDVKYNITLQNVA